MTNSAICVSFALAALLAGCAGDDAAAVDCALTVHPIDADGGLGPPALEPQHVARLEAWRDPVADQPGVHVFLTPDGAERNRRFTQAQVGRPIAIACNGREVARPMVMDASDDEFVFLTGGDDAG